MTAKRIDYEDSGPEYLWKLEDREVIERLLVKKTALYVEQSILSIKKLQVIRRLKRFEYHITGQLHQIREDHLRQRDTMLSYALT